ncbi:hypothetical protein C8R44DRAFT_885336 [Mycena epipterygia]|nr:hypothetical protein C8R44DRAFT_885336 [Mycena epipterygia]
MDNHRSFLSSTPFFQLKVMRSFLVSAMDSAALTIWILWTGIFLEPPLPVRSDSEWTNPIPTIGASPRAYILGKSSLVREALDIASSLSAPDAAKSVVALSPFR